MKKEIENLTFNEFCMEYLEMYTPNIPLESQGSGYNGLRNMVLKNIKPASLSEIKRWETEPTEKELYDIPHTKYMRFLHPLLRPIIINNWNYIKSLEME